MDPLDPITEIINSGQAFSPSIALERIVWVLIGFFFLGAISTSILRGMQQKGWFGNSSFLASLKVSKNKDDSLKNLNDSE